MEEMLCPECMGPLETTDGKTARCTLHGGDYEILFSRLRASEPLPDQGPLQARRVAPAGEGPTRTKEMMPSEAAEMLELSPAEAAAFLKSSRPPSRIPEAPTASSGRCVRHPGKPAKFACRSCKALICETCAFPQADGSQLCPDCATAKPPRRSTVPSAAAGPPKSLIGVMCVVHPEVQAARRCKVCRTPICETCTFSFPGRLNVCPKCATSADQGLTPKRRSYVVWSFVCAVVGTLGYLLLFAAAPLGLLENEADVAVFGVVSLIWILGSSITGVALAAAARIPGRPRPLSVWGCLIWNVVLLVGYGLLVLVGTLA